MSCAQIEDRTLEAMSTKFYDIEPRSGSHCLLENGVPIARFDDLEKADRGII